MPAPLSIKSAIPNSRILIVDDDEMIRMFIEVLLNGSGFENLLQAQDGWEALEALKTTSVDCVILDINMPGMGGRDVLRHIPGSAKTKDLPVLVITAQDAREDRNEIMRAGATNLISKPLDQELLLELLNTMLERKIMVDQLSSFHNRLSQELAQAANMQAGLIPKADAIKALEARYSVKIASAFQPSSELGGDFWTAQIIDHQSFGILIADFSGHGVSAALNTFQLNMLLNRLGPCDADPARYLSRINDELSQVVPLGQYCTMTYAMVDIGKNAITYAAAASPPPISGTCGESDISIGDGSGVPLGIKADNVYENRHIDFHPGQFAFFFSDVFFETKLAGMDVLEIDGLATFARHHSDADAHKALGGMLKAFYDNAPSPLPDDLTAIWITR
ncbi:SpoIIE family protein phosphatase [Magnetovibrio sp. PR-2]|uniref:PP2C family protein-serine/threonine phosphatase n=1 Tax=Magnetovibrio sp. PR-2 TaxID=3120356 RepID=UPI002FCDE75F